MHTLTCDYCKKQIKASLNLIGMRCTRHSHGVQCPGRMRKEVKY